MADAIRTSLGPRGMDKMVSFWADNASVLCGVYVLKIWQCAHAHMPHIHSDVAQITFTQSARCVCVCACVRACVRACRIESTC